MICFVEKQPFEMLDEGSITDTVYTVLWGAERTKKFGGCPGVSQLLVNNRSGTYNFSFSEWPVKADTIFTIEGLPEVINSITILVI